MLILQLIDGTIADARFGIPARSEPEDTGYTMEVQDFDVPDDYCSPLLMTIDGDQAIVYHVTAVT